MTKCGWTNDPRRYIRFFEQPHSNLVAFAQHIGVPLQRVNEIIRGKRGITPETAWLFSQALGTTPQFWMNLQNAYDLTSKRPERTVKRLIKAG